MDNNKIKKLLRGGESEDKIREEIQRGGATVREAWDMVGVAQDVVGIEEKHERNRRRRAIPKTNIAGRSHGFYGRD